MTQQIGSPALAGIDRLQPLSQNTTLRFPRTRGDRPRQPERTLRRQSFPRTRGDRPLCL